MSARAGTTPTEGFYVQFFTRPSRARSGTTTAPSRPHRHRTPERRRSGVVVTAAIAVGATAMAALAGTTPVGAELAARAHTLTSTHHAAKATTHKTSNKPKASGKGTTPPPSSGTTSPVVVNPGGGSGASGSTGGSAAGVKAPMIGLLDRHHAPTGAWSSLIKGYVVNTSWADLQPTENGPIVHPNAIDNAITVAAARGYTLKLRIRAGVDAPQWAKTLDGTPVTMHYTAATVGKTGQVAGTVGRFWMPKFQAAYAQLQVKLAALYDNVPQIRQTDITMCQTIFSETYLRDTMDKNNAKALLAAGYSIAADEACHNAQIQDHLVWQHTRSDVAFNPYTAIYPDGSVKQDMPYTLSQMVYCRQILGVRCVLENHSLSDARSTTNANYTAIYAEMQKLDGGGAFDFQTATMGKIGNFDQVLSWAANYGATSVELPTGYTSMSPTPLLGIDAKF